jgi:hypothetical protein
VGSAAVEISESQLNPCHPNASPNWTTVLRSSVAKADHTRYLDSVTIP